MSPRAISKVQTPRKGRELFCSQKGAKNGLLAIAHLYRRSVCAGCGLLLSCTTTMTRRLGCSSLLLTHRKRSAWFVEG